MLVAKKPAEASEACVRLERRAVSPDEKISLACVCAAGEGTRDAGRGAQGGMAGGTAPQGARAVRRGREDDGRTPDKGDGV